MAQLADFQTVEAPAQVSPLGSSLLVLLNLPFALVGDVIAVVAFGMPVSVSAAVAFIVLLGIAVQNGVVLIAFFRQLRQQGESVARRNFARLGVAPARCRIFTADATSFTALDEYSHIYFCNPFMSPVMRDVATNIRASLARRPRPLTIIYYNSVCVDELTAGDSFRVVATSFDRERNRILVLQGAEAAR